MSTGKVLIGVLAGVVAGAILGVLFAPDKGSETRKKIAKEGSYTADELKGKLNELLSTLTEKPEAIKEETTNLYEKGKHSAEDTKTGITK